MGSDVSASQVLPILNSGEEVVGIRLVRQSDGRDMVELELNHLMARLIFASTG